MKCPHCKDTALVRAKYANANIRKCHDCKGVLLATSRAEKIKRRVNKDIQQLEKELESATAKDGVDEIRCPACHCPMDKKRFDKIGFNVDECRQCGMAWFDAGELAAIQLSFEDRPQTAELNKFRNRLQNMTDQERTEYEQRIAELRDLGTPMEQATLEATAELTFLYYWLN